VCIVCGPMGWVLGGPCVEKGLFTEYMGSMFAQVERDPVGAQALTMSDRTMWQSLMELCCRKGRTADALQVTQRESRSLRCGFALLWTRLVPTIQEKLLFVWMNRWYPVRCWCLAFHAE
jgi:hypothetical protein